jgi:hypothetical protein
MLIYINIRYFEILQYHIRLSTSINYDLCRLLNFATQLGNYLT